MNLGEVVTAGVLSADRGELLLEALDPAPLPMINASASICVVARCAVTPQPRESRRRLAW